MRPTKPLQQPAPRPIAPPPNAAPTPRIPTQLTYLEEKLSAAHSIVGSIEDSVSRLQSPVPVSGDSADGCSVSTTVENRLETTLVVVDGLLERLNTLASRLNALV